MALRKVIDDTGLTTVRWSFSQMVVTLPSGRERRQALILRPRTGDPLLSIRAASTNGLISHCSNPWRRGCRIGISGCAVPLLTTRQGWRDFLDKPMFAIMGYSSPKA